MLLPFAHVLLAVRAALPLAAEETYAHTFTIGAPERAITGLVLAADGSPVAGAQVTAIATPRPGYQGLFADDPTGPTLAATSASDGGFTLQVTRARPFELRVRTPDGRIGYVPTCHAREHVTVRVAPPAEIEIELVQSRNDEPLAGVEVAALWTETSLLRQFVSVPHRIASATTDSAGRATLANLCPGPIDIVYEPSVMAQLPARQWRVLAGEKGKLRVKVGEPRRTITGRVSDRADNPIPGARIAAGLRFERFTIADDEGRFEFTTLVPPGEAWLFVQADGFALDRRPLSDIGSAPEGVRVVLEPGRAVSGRFVDPQGKALAGVPIVVVHDPFTNVVDQLRGTSAVDGSFLLHGMRVDAKHVLLAWAEGRAMCVRSLTEAEFGSPNLSLGEIVLGPEASVEGRFLDIDGVPIPRAEISLAMTPPRADETTTEKSGEQPLDMSFGAQKTDAAGRFRFDGLFAGGATIVGLAQNTMKREVIGIGSGSSRTDVVIRCIAPLRAADGRNAEVGGDVAARVLHADGRPAARVLVELSPEDDTAEPVRREFSDENGRFAFKELHGARYRLALEFRDGLRDSSPLRERRRLTPEEFRAIVEAADGSDGRAIRLNELVQVTGRIVDPREPEGRPWFVRVDPTGPLGFPTCIASDDRGHFEFAMEAGAPFSLWLSPLNPAPSIPRSALNASIAEPLQIRDLKAGSEPIVIQVP